MARTEKTEKQNYIDRLFAQEDELLVSMRNALSGTVFEGIHLGPAEAKFLQILIRLSGTKKIVEVGTLMGYSALWMARALPDDGKVFSIERNVENFRKATAFFEKASERTKVELRFGDGLEQLRKLEEHGPFDMIFIDANKGGYCDYLDWAEQNVKKGGLVIGDNTFLFGQVYGDTSSPTPVTPRQLQVMREFNERLSDSSKYDSIMLPTGEGLTIGIKKT